jgi:hypothetical protein
MKTNDQIKIRANELRNISCEVFAGAPTDGQWLFEEALWLIDNRSIRGSLDFWRVILEAGRAINHLGEYAIAGELFEEIIETARKIRFSRVEFDALEGVAFSWFYLGDRARAIKYLRKC